MSNLRILSANIMKSTKIYYSFLSNEKCRDFLFLLLSKSWANVRVKSLYSALHHYIYWQQFFLSTFNLKNTYNISAFYLII